MTNLGFISLLAVNRLAYIICKTKQKHVSHFKGGVPAGAHDRAYTAYVHFTTVNQSSLAADNPYNKRTKATEVTVGLLKLVKCCNYHEHSAKAKLREL